MQLLTKLQPSKVWKRDDLVYIFNQDVSPFSGAASIPNADYVPLDCFQTLSYAQATFKNTEWASAKNLGKNSRWPPSQIDKIGFCYISRAIGRRESSKRSIPTNFTSRNWFMNSIYTSKWHFNHKIGSISNFWVSVDLHIEFRQKWLFWGSN